MVSLSAVPISKRLISVILFCGLTVFLIAICRETIATSPLLKPYLKPQDAPKTEQGRFWYAFRQDLDAHAPTVSPFDHPHDTNLAISFDSSNARARPGLLWLSYEQQDGLKKTHSSFVDKLRHKQYALPYVNGTRGIVTTAGGPLLPAALVSILMLRQTGSTLPVEVFLSNQQEWDSEICDKILPTVNAKCLLLQDVFDDAGGHTTVNKYQYKIVSIIMSSFEEVLFMDSDCFPAQNPDRLFESELFRNTGLILWPDFWFPSESPHFFDIAGIPAPPLNEKASTESGVLLYSKRNHELSLLLATYYNYYGPDFYYSLQSQGAPGEGDKETFLWSSVVMKEPYYAVQGRVRALGYHTKAGEWRGSAMAQSDPVQDYNMTFEEHQAGIKDATKLPRPFFVHVNFPKLDPGQIFEVTSFGAAGPTQDSDGTIRRIWHTNESAATSFFGFDLERRVWHIVKSVACKYEKAFISWRDKTDVCQKAENYWNTVFGE